MGKLQEFAIRLDKRGAVYTSGDVVSGHLVVSLSGPMKVRGIRVTFLGRAGVNWKETKTQDANNKKTVLVHFNAEELYLNQRQVLWGEDSDRDFIGVLSEGYYEFPFSVNLPKNLPCSFEGDHGCVSYKVKATIDKPWKKDHHIKSFFTVISAYDLNNDPHASEAIEHEAEQTVCCGCCKAGYFSLRYFIDRRGFVPGEEIPIVIEVKNKSSRRLLSEIKFKMVTTYFAHDDSKKQEEELDRFDMDPVSAHSTGALKTTIDIPPTPPSHLPFCDIIDVDYIIRLKIAPEGCNFDSLEFHDEILVGTHPLRHVVARMMGSEGWSILKKAMPILTPNTLTTTQGGAEPDANMELPAPMYASSAHSKGNIDDDDIATTGESFKPQYAFYNWKQLVGRMSGGQPQAQTQPTDQVMARDVTAAQATVISAMTALCNRASKGRRDGGEKVEKRNGGEKGEKGDGGEKGEKGDGGENGEKGQNVHDTSSGQDKGGGLGGGVSGKDGRRNKQKYNVTFRAETREEYQESDGGSSERTSQESHTESTMTIQYGPTVTNRKLSDCHKQERFDKAVDELEHALESLSAEVTGQSKDQQGESISNSGNAMGHLPQGSVKTKDMFANKVLTNFRDVVNASSSLKMASCEENVKEHNNGEADNIESNYTGSESMGFEVELEPGDPSIHRT